MSSWALTSFMKNCEEQLSGVVGMASIIDTELMQPEDFSIEEFSKTALESSNKRKKIGEGARGGNVVPFSDRKSKLLSIQTDSLMPSKTNKLNMKTNELLNPGSVTSKHAQKAIQNRRDSAISPNQDNNNSKGLQSVALVQKAQLEKSQMNAPQQLVKTSRGEREKIRNTPQRDEKNAQKKKPTVGSKTNAATNANNNNQNNLANSRCRSKLSIGSSQTQTQQIITKKATLQQSNNKKQIEKMIKDSSVKMQLDKNNRYVNAKQRTAVASTTNMQTKVLQASLGQNLATLAVSKDDPINFVHGQIYSMNQQPILNQQKPVTKQSSNNANAVNNSRNAKVSSSNGNVKSNSQTAVVAQASSNSET